MAYHPIQDPKKYNQQLRQIETTDDVHPDVVNPLFKQLINNDAYLKEEIEALDHFRLVSATYDSEDDALIVTIGGGRANFLGVMDVREEDEIRLSSPSINTDYYISLLTGGGTSLTAGEEVDNPDSILIHKISTGDPVSNITTEDRRGGLSGAAAQMVKKQFDAHSSEDTTDAHLATNIGFSDSNFSAVNVAEALQELGEIEEEGSNQNGEYIRYKNGIQICHAFGRCYFYEDRGSPIVFDRITASGHVDATWTYPASFADIFASPSFYVRGLMTSYTGFRTGYDAIHTGYIMNFSPKVNNAGISIGNQNVTFYDDRETGEYVGIRLYALLIGRWK
ncbi:hypothetical protein [Salibacterium halotolerans]|uniref:Uncharacterized protein n=1 Tax=Salibacterium halotolerans TaxID=1884432 RepID=A0A1I5NCY9_9BACI|nr:hypothetical protein [Salibacterium halotolerans]SFP19256.1 hypothetical protein SAMN05518683_10374 [Salibacterium halotolerans]